MPAGGAILCSLLPLSQVYNTTCYLLSLCSTQMMPAFFCSIYIQKEIHQVQNFPSSLHYCVLWSVCFLCRVCLCFACRAQLKGQILMSLETSEGFLEDMGNQALAKGSYSSPEEITKNIDNISLTDVANVRHLVLVGALLLFGCSKKHKDMFFNPF